MDEVQQQPRIQAHRAANVTNDDQRARLALSLAPRQLYQFGPVLHVAPNDPAHIGIGPLFRGRFAPRGTHAEIPAHLGHQALGFLHLFPAIVLEILLAQLLDRAIGSPLWRTVVVFLVYLARVPAATTFGRAHLAACLFALIVGVEVLGQAFAFGWRQTHLALFSPHGTFALVFLVRIVANLPVVLEHLIEERLLLVLRQ